MSSGAAIPHRLVDSFRGRPRVTVLSGSGISAESGVPTFRDAQQGLWARYAPTELATPEAFARDPVLVWRWYRWRRELVRRARPNAAHRALVTLAGLVGRLIVVTQNVDGLHHRAGSTDVIEYHGNLFAERCHAGCRGAAARDPDAGLPRCERCGAAMRPAVVWFGEAIPEPAVAAATAAASDCDLFLSVGTSSLVWPAAGLAELAARNGACLVELNPDETPLSAGVDYRLAGKAGTLLPELVDCAAR